MKKSGHGEKSDLQLKIQLLTGKDFWYTQEYAANNVPSFKFSDGPHGLRTQGSKGDNLGLNGSLPATCFAESSSVACSFDEELLYETGVRLGQEAAHYGANVLLGPAVNIKRNPLNGRNFEYFSEDPYLTGRLAAAYIKGVQQNGVSCCVKHFAANNREYARTVCDSVLSERALREIYLQPFEMCVKEGGAGAVMTAYNKVNGEHCSQNKRLISDILRGEWGFDSIVISDWVGTYDRVEGVRAGEDIEMPCCPLTYEEVEDAVKQGRLKESDIDACIDRIARFANRWTGSKDTECDFEEHSAFAKKCAESSIVLLKNDGILPLKSGTKVAVVGAFAQDLHVQGGGSANVNCYHTDDMLALLKDKFTVTGYEPGFDRSGKYNKKLLNRALKLAGSADIVICFVGMTDKQETEGADKSGISLPFCQTELVEELVKSGKKVIAVLSSGSAVQTEWDSGVSALIQTGLFGQSGGGALAEILCGEVNPSGKLAESYPVSYGDLPCAQTFDADPYREEYTEDVFVGYRWFDGAGISPKYPFGYGLSYTTFEYSDLQADSGGASFTITNTGKADGAEVAQLYMSAPDCGIPQLVKALKGFKKVYLKAGESARVRIDFDGYTFRTYDEKHGNWRIYAGEYVVKVGSSSQNILLESTVTVSGDKAQSTGGRDKAKIITEAAKNAKPQEPIEEEGRKEITLYSNFSDLKHAKGAGGRLLYRIANWYVNSKNNPSMQTLSYMYMRSIAQYARFNGVQAQGLLLVCNGHLFKGLKKIIFKK